jgi:hypothetical protein
VSANCHSIAPSAIVTPSHVLLQADVWHRFRRQHMKLKLKLWL